ncbi:receptor-like protein kinase FERONIA [Juglans microcarpa x Juglans regia]|uniref:receptor-like protein kinase FERONIA n=1 Tax=Juglans microcarpa x Juglans regia TaxID=2249226 RepID=UPI001B7EE93F|nr:receptor-like protein kinase FERONIA [Juglans microcarpa x Juglans regia]
MVSMLTPMIFLFVFLAFQLLCHISIAAPPPPTPLYTADDDLDDISLNCGAFGNSKAMDGRLWIGEMDSKFTPLEDHNHPKSVTSTAQQQDTVDPVPYTTARLSYSPFTYVFPITASGQKILRFYFYPASYVGFDRSKLDFFTVQAGSFILLRNFSASLLANHLGEYTLSKEFCINIEKDQNLTLTFIPTPSRGSTNFYAFINGIEIVSMPDDLYYKPEGEGIPYIGQNSVFYRFYDMALEMGFRLHVGGRFISLIEDAYMYREWSGDGNYDGGAVTPREPYLNLTYTQISNYIASTEVYWSAMSMGHNMSTKNMLISNLTWGTLHVDSGFEYMVRLQYFCEVERKVTSLCQRQFIIYIDNTTAKHVADVMLWSEDRDTRPVYRDYVVMIQNDQGVEGKRKLFVAVHPIAIPTTYKNAILNVIQVFKLVSNPKQSLPARSNLEYVTPPQPAQKTAPMTHVAQETTTTVVAQEPTASITNESSSSKKTIISIAIGSVVGFLAVAILVCCKALSNSLTKCSAPDKGKSTRAKASSLPGELCRRFSLEEITTATHNFHEELIIGVGGFGKVFKGLVEESTMTVAIKRLNPESKQGRKEFWTEIEMLSQLRHVHLVSLIGYCNDEGEMILVYDYMANGTLRDHLYDTNRDPLPWIQRLEICIGAACGLNYLHTVVKHPIIHRDVKTTNILLDESCVAKVSDFGLSKVGLENAAVSTMVKGTFGYLDPDYARRRQLTEKSDVYSFGVVLLEVLCARKALNPKLEEEQWNLANWAKKCIEKGIMGEIIDPNLIGNIAPECFKVYMNVAENCVRDQGIQRPTMNDVMGNLNFALQLQKEADIVKKEANAADNGAYTEVLSFDISDITGARRYNNVFSVHVSESDSGTWLISNNTGDHDLPESN